LYLKTLNNLITTYVYGEYQSKHPEQNTVKDVQRDVQEKNLEVNQLVIGPTDFCQQAETSADGGRSA